MWFVKLLRQLIFIEASAEHRANLLWQCLKVREGRRKRSKSVAGSLRGHQRGVWGTSSRVWSPHTLFHSIGFEIVLDLLVDDAYVT